MTAEEKSREFEEKGAWRKIPTDSRVKGFFVFHKQSGFNRWRNFIDVSASNSMEIQMKSAVNPPA